jgi:hypothetical protein
MDAKGPALSATSSHLVEAAFSLKFNGNISEGLARRRNLTTEAVLDVGLVESTLSKLQLPKHVCGCGDGCEDGGGASFLLLRRKVKANVTYDGAARTHFTAAGRAEGTRGTAVLSIGMKTRR